jgi:hypothetical protein
MNHWMFRCKEVAQMVSESMDRNLPFFQRMGMRIHLLMCRLCAENRRQFLILRKLMRHCDEHGEDIESSATLTPEARERVKRSLCQK